MPMLKMRITGSEDDVRAISNLLQSIDGTATVEEIDALL